MKTKNIAFIITNALLIAAVGLILGFLCPNIFNNGIKICSYALLLVTLAIPSLIYFVFSKIGFGSLVLSTLLMVAELAINITFMCIRQPQPKVYGIVQASIIGAFLIAYLILIASLNKKEA